MKTLDTNKLIPKYNLNIRKGINYEPSYLLKYCDFDFDVKLSNGKNLQRELVWDKLQKQSLIISVLKGIKLPTFCAVLYKKDGAENTLFKIIDGKQRLTTLFSFINNEWPIEFEGEQYFYSNLDYKGRQSLSNANLIFDVIYEYDDTRLTDEQLIAWFELVNFAGTQQDINHINYLKQ